MAEDINFRALPAEKLDIPDVLNATRQSEIMSAYSSLGEIRKAEALLSKVTTVAGLADKIDSIGKAALLVTDFQTKGGLSEKEAIALAGLHHALGYLPVLGTLYQNVIEGFCGFLPEYRKIVADKQRVATDAIGFLKERHGQ